MIAGYIVNIKQVIAISILAISDRTPRPRWARLSGTLQGRRKNQDLFPDGILEAVREPG